MKYIVNNYSDRILFARLCIYIYIYVCINGVGSNPVEGRTKI